MPQPKLFSQPETGLASPIAALFEPLCVLSTQAELCQLQADVTAHVETVRAAWQHNEFLDLTAVQQSAAVLELLLLEYPNFSPAQQRLIVGAARYFVNTEDAEPDTESLLGFEDDIQVINHVLDQVGWCDFKLQA